MAEFGRGEGRGVRVARVRAADLAIGLVLLVALVSEGCKSPPKASGKNSAAPEVKAVLHLESFVVNLADPEDNHFLRIGIDLGLANPVTPKKEGEGVVPTARIRDCILEVLSTWHSDALLAPEGKQKLKAELLAALRRRVPDMGVKEIYFTDFLVQR